MLVGKLPIKRLTLYQHGVAFIERRAVFNSREPLQLMFEDSEMNDVLKSLCIFDMGRGKVTGVSYETAEDLEAQIAEKAIRVPRDSAVLGIMEAVRGYNVIASLDEKDGEQAVVGRMLGLERASGTRYPLPPAEKGLPRPPGLNMVMIDDAERITTIPLERLKSLRLNDSFAQSDLEYFLDASRSLRKKSFKGMTVYLDGDEHDLTLGYLTTMPAWRVSYRLLFEKDEARLQGWGIVENLMEEDLERVELSLISGMPISFIYEIYTPSSIKRPYVHEDRAGMHIPVNFEQDADLDYTVDVPEHEEHEAPEYYDKGGYESAFAQPELDEEEVEKEVALTAGSELTTMVDSEAVDLGETFRYDIETPVSIKRGQSALVPLFDTTVDCQKEHLYNKETTGRNPLVCMLISNNLGKILDRGPITVVDGDIYAGEAILPFTTYDADNRIAYATDQAVECVEEIKRYEEPKDFSRDEHNLKVETWLVEQYDYAVHNSKDGSILMLVEHPVSKEFEVHDTPDMLEETENFKRWRFDVGAKTKTVFTVKQRKSAVEHRDIRSLSEEEFTRYVKTGKMSKELEKFCREVMDLAAKVKGNQKEIGVLRSHMQALESDVSRLENNMSSIANPASFKELKNRSLDHDLDGTELVAFEAEKGRNPKEAMLYQKYFEAASEHRKRISRRQDCIEFLEETNRHINDTIDHMFDSRRSVRRKPEEDLSEQVKALLAEDLIKFLINPIQEGGV